MKKEFKPGEWIRFVGPSIRQGKVWHESPTKHLKAKINGVMPDGRLSITCHEDEPEDESFIHRRQVTHRIVPKKRREFWVVIYKSGYLSVNRNKPEIFADMEDCFLVREVRK